MGKRKRILDKKSAEEYVPEFTRSNEILNNDIHTLFREIDPEAHEDTKDSRVVNSSKRQLQFSKNDQYIPSSNQRKAMKLAKDFEEHLKDHAQYFQSLTRSEKLDFTSESFKSSIKESESKKRKIEDKVDPAEVHHMCLRGLGKKVSEKEFRKLMGDVPFMNLRMHTGKSRVTGFVVIGDKALEQTKKLLHDKKLYGKKLQLWEKLPKVQFTGDTRYVYVGNLPPGTTSGMIGGHLLTCGKIRHVTMVPNKSCCFIRFKHRSGVQSALQYNNTFFNGFYIRVSEEKNVNDLVLDRFNEEESDVNLDQFDSDLEEK